MISFDKVGQVVFDVWKVDVDLGDIVYVYGVVISLCCGELFVLVDCWWIVVKLLWLFFVVYKEMSEELWVCQCYVDFIV